MGNGYEWYQTLSVREMMGYEQLYPELTYSELKKQVESDKRIFFLFAEEYQQFLKNKSVNPVTGKKIKKGGPVYMKLKNSVIIETTNRKIKNPRGNFMSHLDKPRQLAVLCANGNSIWYNSWEGLVPMIVKKQNIEVTYVVSPEDYDYIAYAPDFEYLEEQLLRGLQSQPDTKFDYMISEYCPLAFPDINKLFLMFVIRNLKPGGLLFLVETQVKMLGNLVRLFKPGVRYIGWNNFIETEDGEVKEEMFQRTWIYMIKK